MPGDNPRPIRPRNERAAEARSPQAGMVAPAEQQDTQLAELQEQADALGLNLIRKKRPRRGRPEARPNGKVPMTCHVSLSVRRAMDDARIELNVTLSDLIERSVIHYLRSEGLYADELPPVG